MAFWLAVAAAVLLVALGYALGAAVHRRRLSPPSEEPHGDVPFIPLSGGGR